MPDTTVAALEKLVEKAGQLYSLPSVAMEVLRLTESPTVDVKQLKETIERDPALCVKLLKVVNSSLFGLSGRVSDLNQALALLGVEPLKMLVLGFSLPDALFAKLAGEPLRRYWTVSLTRAVCARSLAEHDANASGDEAFLAGLLCDLGQLVMIQQLGEPYLRFLELASDKPGQLFQLEQQSLGFDHAQLSAQLLRSWRLPARLAVAVEHTGDAARREEPLAEIVDLSELVLQLLLDKRLDVLPELVERCEARLGLSKEDLKAMLEPLQERVDQLAAAMSIELCEGLDHHLVLARAHAALAALAEKAVGDALAEKSDDQIAEDLLAESHEVRLAMREFLRGPRTADTVVTRAEGAHPPRDRSKGLPVAELSKSTQKKLGASVTRLAERCREVRSELSLVILHTDFEAPLDAKGRHDAVVNVLKLAHQRSQPEEANQLTLDARHTAVLMPGVDRRTAVAYSNAAVEEAAAGAELKLKAGVASITLVPNRFEADRLVSAALGCLNATLVHGSTAVKSIEVY